MTKKRYKKVILVTGSSKGIGNSIANHFLKSSDNLVIGCSRSNTLKRNKNYIHVQVDLSKNEGVNDLSLYIRNEIKTLNVLINNAGVASMNHLLLTTEKKSFLLTRG